MAFRYVPYLLVRKIEYFVLLGFVELKTLTRYSFCFSPLFCFFIIQQDSFLVRSNYICVFKVPIYVLALNES